MRTIIRFLHAIIRFLHAIIKRKKEKKKKKFFPLILSFEKEKEKERERKRDAPFGTSPSPYHEISDSVDVDLPDCKRKILSDRHWIEILCMNNSISREMFDSYLDDFFRTLQNRGETKKSAKDAKFHFASWLNYERQKQRCNDRHGNGSTTNPATAAGYGEE